MPKDLKPSVLVVEDEESIAAIMKYHLKKAGYSVLGTDDGSEAIEMAKQHRPDLILLDWMLPSVSGIEVCRVIRAMPDIENTPIIMVSARGEEVDKIVGLERGADDYIAKPFSPQEMIVRIKAVLRRIRPAFSEKVLSFEDIKVNLATRMVTRHDIEVKLSRIEFQILLMLMENPGRVLSRETLMDKIWGVGVFVGSRTIDVHITRLRHALRSASPSLPDLIRTVRLGGYTLRRKQGAKVADVQQQQVASKPGEGEAATAA